AQDHHRHRSLQRLRCHHRAGARRCRAPRLRRHAQHRWPQRRCGGRRGRVRGRERREPPPAGDGHRRPGLGRRRHHRDRRRGRSSGRRRPQRRPHGARPGRSLHTRADRPGLRHERRVHPAGEPGRPPPPPPPARRPRDLGRVLKHQRRYAALSWPLLRRQGRRGLARRQLRRRARPLRYRDHHRRARIVHHWHEPLRQRRWARRQRNGRGVRQRVRRAHGPGRPPTRGARTRGRRPAGRRPGDRASGGRGQGHPTLSGAHRPGGRWCRRGQRPRRRGPCALLPPHRPRRPPAGEDGTGHGTGL
ncbi:MAG: Dehydrogenases with different specificities (related to short-chain alcohol dehydrogenases), partial [uncultured Acidimicrobiales bacterium]